MTSRICQAQIENNCALSSTGIAPTLALITYIIKMRLRTLPSLGLTLPMSTAANDFLAEVEVPPPPVVVLLAHTDFVTPSFPTLLMHEDLDLGPPPQPTPKKIVTFQPPQPSRGRRFAARCLAPASDSEGEELSLSKISLAVPRNGPSHVK